MSKRAQDTQATTDQDSHNQKEARRLHEPGPCDWLGALWPPASEGDGDGENDRECQPDE